MQRPRPAGALLPIALLIACAIESNEGDDGGAHPSSRSASGARANADAVDAATARPQTRVDTLFLEGMAEPVTLTLVRAPNEFPLPFSTYTAGDFIVESVASTANGESAVRFIAAFGGVRNDEAFLEVAAYPAGTTEAEAAARAERAVGARGHVVAAGEASMEWAVRQWRLEARDPRGGWTLGFAGLGRHGDRWFHILARYPAEYADGFGPRAGLILEHWRWDDGTALTRPAAP